MWKKTQRDEIIGNELFKLEDRKKRQLCLCPTHEEIVTSLVANSFELKYSFTSHPKKKILSKNQIYVTLT